MACRVWLVLGMVAALVALAGGYCALDLLVLHSHRPVGRITQPWTLLPGPCLAPPGAQTGCIQSGLTLLQSCGPERDYIGR